MGPEGYVAVVFFGHSDTAVKGHSEIIVLMERGARPQPLGQYTP